MHDYWSTRCLIYINPLFHDKMVIRLKVMAVNEVGAVMEILEITYKNLLYNKSLKV